MEVEGEDYQETKSTMTRNTRNHYTGTLNVVPETCCDECGQIVANYFDCPVCGRTYSPSEQHGEIEPENGVSEITCGNCGTQFTTDGNWFDDDAIWRADEKMRALKETKRGSL